MNVYGKLAGVSALLLAQNAMATESDLQQQINRLEAEISKLKVSVADQPASSTSFSYGGYIKLDAIISQYSDGERALAAVGDDLLVASVIPVSGEGGDAKFDMNAKSSRFWMKTKTATDHGNIRTHVELDFAVNQTGDERISNSSAPRMRHAYVAWDYDDNSSVLAGQSWSTFFNVGSLPETVDFVGPVGTLFERQAQIRWTRKQGNHSWMLAAENPSTGLYGGGGAAGGSNYDNNSMPDLVLRYNQSTERGSYAVAVIAREISYKESATLDDSTMGYGVSFSGKRAIGNDELKFQLNAGNALGRYMGLQSFRDGVIDANGEIELIDQVGGYVAYRHPWNKQWRSTLVLSASSADNPDTVAASTASDYQSAHLNLLYSPVKKLTLGAELIHGQKEVQGGDRGELNRLQFCFKYVF